MLSSSVRGKVDSLRHHGALEGPPLLTRMHHLSIVVRRRLHVTATDFIAIVRVALDIEIERLAAPDVQRHVIVLVAGVQRAHEGHGVQREFKFGTDTDEGRTHELLDTAFIRGNHDASEGWFILPKGFRARP